MTSPRPTARAHASVPESMCRRPLSAAWEAWPPPHTRIRLQASFVGGRVARCESHEGEVRVGERRDVEALYMGDGGPKEATLAVLDLPQIDRPVVVAVELIQFAVDLN